MTDWFEEKAKDMAEILLCMDEPACFWPDTDCKHHERIKKMCLEALREAARRQKIRDAEIAEKYSPIFEDSTDYARIIAQAIRG